MAWPNYLGEANVPRSGRCCLYSGGPMITEDDVRKISNGLAQDNGGNLFLNT